MAESKRIVNHPGVYVKDAIESLGLSQSDFTSKTGLSIKNVSMLINGKANITLEVADKLAAFFNNSTEGWIGLQTKFNAYIGKTKNKEF